MSDELRYTLTLGVSNGADTEGIEDFLQQVLLDLYEQGQVESITVTKDGHTSSVGDEDIKEIVRLIDDVDSDAVRKAIESVRELERSDDE